MLAHYGEHLILVFLRRGRLLIWGSGFLSYLFYWQELTVGDGWALVCWLFQWWGQVCWE